MTPKEKLEQILGGKITTFEEEPLPGKVESETTEVVYVLDTPNLDIAQQLKQLVRRIDPPHLKHGGALATHHALRLPTGELFHAFSYRGDLVGWRRQITEGGAALGLRLGWIKQQAKFVTSDGAEYELGLCEHVRI
jgi:hypothetical protein